MHEFKLGREERLTIDKLLIHLSFETSIKSDSLLYDKPNKAPVVPLKEKNMRIKQKMTLKEPISVKQLICTTKLQNSTKQHKLYFKHTQILFPPIPFPHYILTKKIQRNINNQAHIYWDKKEDVFRVFQIGNKRNPNTIVGE